MCGIAGILSHDSSQTDMHRLTNMTNALQHRGPDGEGYWRNAEGTVAFGHRRLAVIDLSAAAAQPFMYTSRYTLVFNGEIYNYPELKTALIQKGYAFNTSSDTEVLAAAYDCWQSECLQKLEGMFAFGIWDEVKQELFLARDRFGEKPLFYSYKDGSFLFASECKALWAAGINRSWNHLLLLGYLSNGHTQNALDASLTFYKDIDQIPPGHYGLYRLKEQHFSVNLYWDLDKQMTVKMTEEEASEQFAYLFRQSVMRRLRSDVAVGTSLSGGLDSSSIVAMISAIVQGNSTNFSRHAFTATFPGYEKNEQLYAERVSQQFGLIHHTVTPSLEGLMDDWDRLCYYQEQPFASASVYAQYKVMELAAKEGVTVLIDGQGADETLAGYNRYVHWYLQEQVARFRYGFAMQERIRLQQNNVAFTWGFPNYMAALFPVVANAALEERERKKILMHPHLHPDYIHAHYDKYYSVYKPPVSKLNDILYFNTMQQGLGELLHYADRNSMAFGRELRLPFLSHELVEFVFSLPAHYKIHYGFTKWILRNVMKDKLPESIVWRTDKVGYEPPQKKWMEHPALRERIHEARERLINEGILNKKILDKPIKAAGAYEADNYDWRYLC
ncbi:MAG: asparagine synthase (glutamine-hydrolyzing), partial [Bacteroidota bacterium]